MNRGLTSRFKNWFFSLSTMQAFWFYVAFILIIIATILHNPMSGYYRDSFYLPRIEVQTPFPSDHMYYSFWYSGGTDRENGLDYLEMGKDRELLAASGISPEAIGKKIREEHQKYEEHKLEDRKKEEEWVLAMEQIGWQRGASWNADLTKPRRWIADPRGWNSYNPFVIPWLPNLSNLLNYLVSIAAILSLTGALGWLAGIRATGSRADENIGLNPPAGFSGYPADEPGISCTPPRQQGKRPWWRTFIAIVVCGILALGYFIGSAKIFGWKNGGGVIPMLIAGTIVLFVWNLIRGGTSEAK